MRLLVGGLAAVGTLVLSGCANEDDGDSGVRLSATDTSTYADSSVRNGADVPVEATFGPPVEAPKQISSPFGPRWKYSDQRYDFHRGIDYYGDRGAAILAIGAGTVSALYPEGSAQYPNGGNTLVVRHDLPDPFAWQGHTAERVYAVYLHLESFAVSEGDTVTTGQTIGTMGDSGSTSFVHLHFETRVQTVCSLEYQQNNPSASCAGYDFDPHVNPYVFVGGVNEDDVLLEQPSNDPLTLVYTAGRGDLDLNRIETDLGTLNFNRRTGIDASSTEALDDFDYGWVRLVPREFVSASEQVQYELHFPVPPTYVEITDIHGTGIRRSYAE